VNINKAPLPLPWIIAVLAAPSLGFLIFAAASAPPNHKETLAIAGEKDVQLLTKAKDSAVADPLGP
jgi:hypothetical protein